ncbi:major facilitator superfamily domain-containing protein [Halteromyces radiatus]|uniref:major facilitator superfamily domain-containing protein n=1 Tax=Halteromyces radiatus TaxID=101107 RepID=UPI00221E96EC|nr:major facilitator superfamily domain-containing protein [Halteromyces radiatus]KAI8085004.1 major facilitator superfamily domain-containing protein [Halteromyces radiatus]
MDNHSSSGITSHTKLDVIKSDTIRQRTIPSHRSDQSTILSLDPNIERRLLRKLDWRIVPWIFILYFLSVEDRVNVGFSFTMNKQQGHDLATAAHLTARENNIGLGLFYVAYIFFEVPSNLIMANVNPAYWIARIMITWSIVTCCMAAISQAWHFYLLRFLLGVFEAGFWPAYYTTLWYRPEEISSRIGIMYLAGPASGAFGGLISAGIQLIDMRGNLYGWQWLFLISGLLSLVFGFATLFVLPSKPDQSKGFLTEEETRMVQQRIDKGHQDMLENDNNNGKTSKKTVVMRDLRNLRTQLMDYKVWLFCVLYFTPVMAATSLGYFLPKIVQQIGTYDSIQVSLMSIPPYVFGGLMVLIVTRLSDRCKDRGWFIIGMCLTSFTGFVILSFTKSVGTRYFGLMVVAGGTYPTVPLSMAWTANSKEDAVAVASATGIVSSVANVGALICTFALYSGWEADAPNYMGSNMVVGGAMLLAAVCAVVLKFRLKQLNKMIDTGTKVGNGGRDYRYLL